ncbi:hypothetical protein Nepgr_032280 [Nepenthes gracilis]|uniref:Uncharacterized protein n=1 Tax=Nepenthes gracilis TaxID=150966 RepID=A0AAD3TKI8_NEPGR|nr:hypothetical protein Nepgr_032280 [Nepenthes gracilis]
MAAWLGCGGFKLSWDAIVRWLNCFATGNSTLLMDGVPRVVHQMQLGDVQLLNFFAEASRLQFLVAAIRITTMWLLSSHVLHVMMRRLLALFERMRLLMLPDFVRL